MLVKVYETPKKLWKYSPAARVPTSFFVLPNFHSCFYDSIETRYMFFISYIMWWVSIVAMQLIFCRFSVQNLRAQNTV